ncbi:TM2 domain protein [Dictyocaulus viviparus]|uniref:TM2 domain protein n=1 Tax=Dictyocaulus viviparus TaxID=29172 RepID=A0A0D8XSG0_DICVI|nr:TM2 domain protein [Dictyocaulus viviparus]
MVRTFYLHIQIWAFIVCSSPLVSAERSKVRPIKQCHSLRSFQYICEPPIINVSTQQPLNCNADNSIPNSCSHNAHIHHSNALLLSLFFGFLGIDRIYLGYYAIGIIKMFSLGGLFVLWLIDVVLISLQLLVPGGGSGYIINYYGPRFLQYGSGYIINYYGPRVSTSQVQWSDELFRVHMY